MKDRAAVWVLAGLSVIGMAAGCRKLNLGRMWDLNVNPPDARVRSVMSLQEQFLEAAYRGEIEGVRALLHEDVAGTTSQATLATFLSSLGQRRIAIDSIAPREGMVLEFTATRPKDGDGLFRWPPLPSKVFPPRVICRSPITGTQIFLVSEARDSATGGEAWLSAVAKEQGDTLRMVRFYFNAKSCAGHEAQWYADQADEFEDLGQSVNAEVYREIALNLLPSPFYTPIGFQELIRKQSAFQGGGLPRPGVRPAEAWSVAPGKTLPVYYVAPVTATDWFALEIRYTSGLADLESPQAHQERAAVFRYALSQHPEFATAFEKIFIGSSSVEGRGFREFFEVSPPGS